MWGHRKKWRHKNNVAPDNVAPPVLEMRLRNVPSASGGKVDALLPTPCDIEKMTSNRDQRLVFSL